MSGGLDPLSLAGAKAKGKRPWFFDNPDTERVMNITLALMQEVAVMRERLDTVERLLERDGSVTREAIETFEPTKPEANERGAMMQEYIARCLRILQQDREAIEQPQEASSEDVAEEFAKTD
ncbi:MAG: hypothetical protein HRU11_11200 [Parvularculaceae bacterium]|nr:hypothetical protein [Parvularculaceae bacterium]